MILARPIIAYLAKELSRRLAKGACQIKDQAVLGEAFETIIVDELSLEDEINVEVRELLNQYGDYMRQKQIPYQEMFRKVKRKVLEERGVVSAQAHGPGERTMKISRDKLTELSHKLAARLPRTPGVRVLKGWNEVRLEIQQDFTDILRMEETVDRRAREMIESQQREIPEGSEEWSVLHRRYYEQEMRRHGIELHAPETPQL